MQTRVRQVARLLFKEPTGVNAVARSNYRICKPVMVKREPTKVTVGSAATVNALADTGIKKGQAWRYPNNKIQRAESTTLNGTPDYYDHIDTDKPRRKQESNFFITINTNRAMTDGGVLAQTGKEVMRHTLNELAKDEYLCTYLKFGPKHPQVYGKDKFDDVIQKCEWNAAVELGENLQRLHCHIWLTVHHYSQVQVNMPVMQRLFKKVYNEYLFQRQGMTDYLSSGLRCNKMPYIQVKLLPTSDWAEVMKQYIHKAMQS